MLEFAFAGQKPVGNFAQRARLSQLTEEHRDELVPTRKALGSIIRFEVPRVSGKIRTLKKGKNLAKKTAGRTHFGLRGWWVWVSLFSTLILTKGGDLLHF